MKAHKVLGSLLVVAMLVSVGTALTGCATNSKVADLEERIDRALSEAQSAQAAVRDVTRKLEQMQASADMVQQYAGKAQEAANYAESMANKAEAIFEQKMKK
jgi:hypothetical protein